MEHYVTSSIDPWEINKNTIRPIQLIFTTVRLIRMGAKKGDVIGMVLPNIPEFPLVFLGAAGVNVSVTTMNPTYRPEELAKQLENSGAKGSRKT